MSTPWDVQVAVMAALNGDAQLPAFYDVVPPEVSRPYGTYGAPTATGRPKLGKQRLRHSLELNWWGNDQETKADGGTVRHGNRQVAQHAARARVVLDGNLLTLATGTMVRLRWVQDTFLPEPDRNVRRVRQVYTVDTE